MIVSMLFGVQPLDLATFAVVTVVLGADDGALDCRPGAARGEDRSRGGAQK